MLPIRTTLVVTPGAGAARSTFGGHGPRAFARPGHARPDRRTADAPRAAPRRLAAELQGLVCDGSPLPAAARVTAAARGFAEGHGFIAGQLVDRTI